MAWSKTVKTIWPKRLWRGLVPLAIIAAAAVIFVHLHATRPVAKLKPPDERVWPVVARSLVIADQQPVLRVFGQVVAGRAVEIRPRVSGKVVSVSASFRDGAVVQAGEPMVGIDPFDYELAVTEKEADVAESEAKLDELRSELVLERQLLDNAETRTDLRRQDVERYRALMEQGTSSVRTKETSELLLTDAERDSLLHRQAINRLEARIEQEAAALVRARATLSMARRDLKDTRLTAPVTGFLTGVTMAVGQELARGERIGDLIEANSLEVRFQLRDEDYARLRAARAEDGGGLIGRPVRVDWHVGNDTFGYDATIERTAGEIDAASGGVDIFARLDAVGPDTPLRAGAFVRVGIPGLLHQDVVKLPATALDSNGQLYVIEDSRIRAVDVEVVGRFQDELLLRGDLPEGTQVVTTQFPELGPGAKVEPR